MIDWTSPIVANASTEQEWDFVRVHRDAALVASDWAMLPDAPTDKQAWEAYRQALRDLPQSASDPRDVVMPTPPTV